MQFKEIKRGLKKFSKNSENVGHKKYSENDKRQTKVFISVVSRNISKLIKRQKTHVCFMSACLKEIYSENDTK